MHRLIGNAGLFVLMGAVVAASQDSAAFDQLREQALEEFSYAAPPVEKPARTDSSAGEIVELPTVYVVEDPEQRARLIAEALAERKRTGEKSTRQADLDKNLRLDVLSPPEIKPSRSGSVFTVSLVKLSW